ncbi:MAG: AAA family ATPase [Clostridia bacterium]|nr:AAA family ATPase [Clostridia bacterium]
MENLEKKSIIMKEETTEDILESLDKCYGVTFFRKKLKEYVEYIRLKKENKINIGNNNIILFCDNTSKDYEKEVEIISKILIKENIIEDDNITIINDLYSLKNIELEKNRLYIIDDENRVDRKLERIIKNNPTCIFVVIIKDSKLMSKRDKDNTLEMLQRNFYWELNIIDPTLEEKMQYIKSVAKQNGLKINLEDWIIKSIAKDSMIEIDKTLIGACIKANKQELEEINTDCFGVDDFLFKWDNPETDKNSQYGLRKLNSLIGLTDVKEQIRKILSYVEVDRERGGEGMTMLHMCMCGNPGTGKSTVARIIGDIFAENNVLRTERIFVEASREDLIGEYVGHTAPKTKKVIQQAIGGVLFIDEAYSLIQGPDGRRNDYGYECIATLIKEMEDYREDLCVILTGYPEEMERLINANPGLKSRIQFFIDFPDYNVEELYEIFLKQIKEDFLKLEKGCKEIVTNYFENEVKLKKENFANGRLVRNLVEKIKFEQAVRIKEKGCVDLYTITPQDIKNVVDKIKTVENKRRIGFGV